MINFLQLRDFSNYKASAWALVAANALPLFGVLFFGWDTFSIVFLYWVENVIIGAINVLKMIACDPDPDSVDWSQFQRREEVDRMLEEAKRSGAFDNIGLLNHGSKFFFVPFFIFHYGMFCLVHGAFIFAIFDREAGGFGPFGGFDNALHVFSQEHLWLGAAALAASHHWSFVVNVLGNGRPSRQSSRTATRGVPAWAYQRMNCPRSRPETSANTASQSSMVTAWPSRRSK
jgi:hypothetical protein